MNIKDIKTNNPERDLFICQAYIEGIEVPVLAEENQVTERRIYQILRKHSDFTQVNQSYEKAKRVHLLQREIKRKKESKKDLADLLQQLKGELEGDKPLIDQSSKTVVQFVRFNADNNDTEQGIPGRTASEPDRHTQEV